MMDLAEKVYVELDKAGLTTSPIRVEISEIIDHAFRIQFQKEEIENKLQSEVSKLLIQLSQREKCILQQQRQAIFDFEKIELILYEKNEYKMLHDCIDFVKACKMNFNKFPTCSNDSKLSEDAFVCSNSLNLQNFLSNKKIQEIVQTINKSSMSLSQKEQLVYNIIKSQTNHLSSLQHVNLEDILNISTNKKKANTSLLSSVLAEPLKQADKLLTNEGFQNCASPKFQFSSLSPIKPIQDFKDKSFRSHKSSELLHSFQQTNSKSQQKVIIPRIKLEGLSQQCNESNKTSENKHKQSAPKRIKRPKQLSLFEKQSFYEKSSIMNMMSNINRSKETKDTENRRSDSQKSRERNHTNHTGNNKPQQSRFLKDLMDKVYEKKAPISKKPYKISDFEKKQLHQLISNIKKQKPVNN